MSGMSEVFARPGPLELRSDGGAWMVRRQGGFMGQYVINGQVVDIRSDHPTAADVKHATGSQPGDWVMATMPGGQVQKLNDADPIPVRTEDLSIVPAFEYGC